MKLLKVAFLCTTFFTFIGATPQSVIRREYTVKVLTKNFAREMKHFRELDLDIAGVSIDEGRITLIVDNDELHALQSQRSRYQDIEIQYSGTRPDEPYMTSKKVFEKLTFFQKTYPNLAQIITVGKSNEGREIYALRMTSSVGTNKPAVLFNGMHHAREVMSSEVPIDIAEQLLTKYGTDPRTTHWLDTAVVYVLPMLNVDGNRVVWDEFAMYRKNTGGKHGVDINRNYPYGWNTCKGSSGNEKSEVYRGPSPSSEPEARALMSLVKQIHPVFNISFHAFSELVIYPYGCPGQSMDNFELVSGIGKKLASLIPRDEKKHLTYRAGTAPDLLYSVDGADLDWMHHEEQVIPFVIELNSDRQGFQPKYKKWRNKTVTKVRPAWQYLLDRLDGPGIDGVLVNQNSERVANAALWIQRTDDPTQKNQQFYRVRPDGSFFVILNPGKYSMRVEGLRSGLITKEFTVGDRRVKFKLISSDTAEVSTQNLTD